MTETTQAPGATTARYLAVLAELAGEAARLCAEWTEREGLLPDDEGCGGVDAGQFAVIANGFMAGFASGLLKGIEAATPEPVKLALVDHRCDHEFHRNRDVYRMVGRCRNCTSEVLGLHTVGHAADSGITGPGCPVCGCTALGWDRRAAPDEIPASESAETPWRGAERRQKQVAGLCDLLQDIFQSLLPGDYDEAEWRDRAGVLGVCDPDGKPYSSQTENDEDAQHAADLQAHVSGMGGPSPAHVSDDAAGIPPLGAESRLDALDAQTLHDSPGSDL